MTNLHQHKLTILVITVIVFGMGTYTWLVVQRNLPNPEVAPALSSLQSLPEQAAYTNLEGTELLLTDHIGSILIVHSWASWCPSCTQQLKELSELQKVYNGDELKVLAINRGEPSTTAERYLKNINVTENVELILDPDDRYYKSIKGYSMPETIVYDSEGNIYTHIRGDFDLTEVEQQVQELLSNEE